MLEKGLSKVEDLLHIAGCLSLVAVAVLINGDILLRLDSWATAHIVIDRIKIAVAGIQKRLKIVDDEIGLLEVVDNVFRAHDPLQVEGDPVRRGVLQCENCFLRRGQDTRTENTQLACFADESELYRIPVETGQIVQLPAFHRAQPALTIGFHELCEHRVGKHWHMAENVMKNVRLLKVFKLLFRADKRTSRKAAIGEMLKKHLIRHEVSNRHNLPACERVKTL